MKKNTIALLFLFVCTIAAVFILAQNRDDETAIPAAQINEAIQTFANLANEKNIQSFGLENVDQLEALKPGRQFKKYMIGLDDIKKYKTGDDVNAMIKELPSIEVSLINESGTILSSIEFEKKEDKWVASGFGLTSDLAGLRNAQSMLADSSLNVGRLIRIPSLHTSFLAVPSSTGINFIVLEDNESLGFRKGAMIAASNALLQLVPVANQYNGLPD
ncbi:MAG TPA: hypothetical protein VE978_26975 [Chitinophagales bacterium]|nr:hypothetical protein [Chitinophagales bacterium]